VCVCVCVCVCLLVQHGETALHFAASGGHLDVLQLLCEKGMDVNVRDKVRIITKYSMPCTSNKKLS